MDGGYKLSISYLLNTDIPNATELSVANSAGITPVVKELVKDRARPKQTTVQRVVKEKKYRCGKCPRAYVHRSCLNKHVRLKYPNLRVFELVCICCY